MSKRGFLFAAIALCLLGSADMSARAQSAADFYKGREIRLLISHPAGGGMDTYARFFARHLSRFLAGHPGVVPQNMPGAAGIVMINSIASQQPSDGTVLAFGPGSMATADLFGASGARYDASKLSWVGSMNADVGIALSWNTSPVKTADDLFKKELVVGAGGATDQSVVFPYALNRILGTKFKVIPGYPGSAGINLALERGEIAGIGGINYSSLLANKPEWLSDDKVNILLQLSLARHSGLSKIPTVLEVAKTEEQRKILELIFSQTELSRSIVGPPAIPADRLQALRSAFDAMMIDKDFLDEAAKLGIELNQPMSGRAIGGLVEKLRSTGPELIKQAAAAVRIAQ